MSHLIAVPIALPLAAAVVLLLLARRPLGLQRALSALATLASLAAAAWLVAQAGDLPTVYRVGDWPVPAAIVLVADRLSALMLLLTDLVAVGALVYACQGTDRRGSYFHPLFQLQLMGLHGAFLTGDLFNLFVFFEVLLIASYCLLLYGGGARRLRAGLHYVVLNLVGSALFLIAVGVLYALTGALNMAELSVRVAALPPGDAALVRTAGLLLLVVFALKAAVAPLYVWLPGAYAAAAGPVAALFALMTKVGVYSIVRVYTLIFGVDGGPAADLALPWLLPAALLTQVLGVAGALASRDLRRLQGYLLVMSVGVMLAGIGLFTEAGMAGGLYYMVHSTLASAAMFLLADLIARQRGITGSRLRQAPAVAQPGVLAPLFFIGCVALVGLPPLSGFLGKALVLAAAPLDARGAWLWGVTLGASVLALVACSRAGSLLFWNVKERQGEAPVVRRGVGRTTPVVALLGAVVLLSVLAGPVADFTRAAARQLVAPADYVRTVRAAR
jgi:multicomponent K+:H+ antiporter subunit D